MGDNTRAAVIRLGLMEMIKFCEVFYPSTYGLNTLKKKIQKFIKFCLINFTRARYKSIF